MQGCFTNQTHEPPDSQSDNLPKHPEGAGMTSLGLRLVGLPGAKPAEPRSDWPLAVDHPQLGNRSGAAVPPGDPPAPLGRTLILNPVAFAFSFNLCLDSFIFHPLSISLCIYPSLSLYCYQLVQGPVSPSSTILYYLLLLILFHLVS